VRIDFGDGTPFVEARSAEHVYPRKGSFTVRVTATDNAGNVGMSERRIRIGGK
jgi:hypothetical protein